MITDIIVSIEYNNKGDLYMLEDKLILVGVLLVMILLVSVLSCKGVIAAEDSDFERYNLSFEIYTEDIGPETMIPVRQFEPRGMNYYEIDDSKVVMAWEESILYVDIESAHVNISGETLEIEKQPVMVNDDLLISFELFEKFVEKTGLLMEDVIDFGEGLADEVEQEEPGDVGEGGVVLMVVPERHEIHAEADEFENGLEIKVILANNTGEMQNFTFSSGQSYDLKLVNEDDEIVYRWSRNKMFIQAIQQLELEAGENKVWETRVPVSDLSPGVYSMQGWLTARGRRINAEVQEIVVE